MEEAFLTGEDLDESTELQDAHHLSVVHLAGLGNCADALDALKGCIHCSLVCAEDIHNTLGSAVTVVNFVDGDGCAEFLLHTLDSLSTLADNGADELCGNLDLDHTGNEGLEVLAGLGDGLEHFAHDVDASLTGLLQGFLKDVVGQTVHLDIHLGGGDTVLGAGYFEVHVAKVIFVTQDVGEDCVAVVGALCVSDKTHCNTCHGLLDLDAGVHQGQAAATDGSHG